MTAQERRTITPVLQLPQACAPSGPTPDSGERVAALLLDQLRSSLAGEIIVPSVFQAFEPHSPKVRAGYLALAGATAALDGQATSKEEGFFESTARSLHDALSQHVIVELAKKKNPLAAAAVTGMTASSRILRDGSELSAGRVLKESADIVTQALLSEIFFKTVIPRAASVFSWPAAAAAGGGSLLAWANYHRPLSGVSDWDGTIIMGPSAAEHRAAQRKAAEQRAATVFDPETDTYGSPFPILYAPIEQVLPIPGKSPEKEDKSLPLRGPEVRGLISYGDVEAGPEDAPAPLVVQAPPSALHRFRAATVDCRIEAVSSGRANRTFTELRPSASAQNLFQPLSCIGSGSVTNQTTAVPEQTLTARCVPLFRPESPSQNPERFSTVAYRAEEHAQFTNDTTQVRTNDWADLLGRTDSGVLRSADTPQPLHPLEVKQEIHISADIRELRQEIMEAITASSGELERLLSGLLTDKARLAYS